MSLSHDDRRARRKQMLADIKAGRSIAEVAETYGLTHTYVVHEANIALGKCVSRRIDKEVRRGLKKATLAAPQRMAQIEREAQERLARSSYATRCRKRAFQVLYRLLQNEPAMEIAASLQITKQCVYQIVKDAREAGFHMPQGGCTEETNHGN